ncbi:restriction endonuclease [Aliivibrio fischeri]|uniref:Restriction endonuclease type IV Mrr domain-containing protein n=1 Tax=Aliivibrio fischeri TaxID=668 RepID=A0A510UER9_ALIFS|nr:restriction endonuclease [Aliivibrio fischeri]GEK13026.1 hypothetical protein AFI02nite_10620 [Aliivibrio fischeri]
MARRGRDLEKVVASIEKHLNKSGFEITSPAYLIDRITQENREIDVLLTNGSGRFLNRVAIECKDWATKVGSPVVEGFHTKIKDLHIEKAIIVSSKVFSAPALDKAKFYNISCLTLDDLSDKKNFFINKVEVWQKYISKNHWVINGHIDLKRKYKVYLDGGGSSFDEIQMKANMQRCMDSICIDSLSEGVQYSKRFNFNPSCFVFVDEDNGERITASEAYLDVEYHLMITDCNSKQFRYSDLSSDDVVARAAFFDYEIQKNKFVTFNIVHDIGDAVVTSINKKLTNN